MPTGPGGLDSNGIWQFGEDDSEALASDLLNLGMGSVSDAFTNLAGVLQVVSTTKTDTFTASLAQDAQTDITGLTAAITPSATSSEVRVQAVISVGEPNSAGTPVVILKRGATSIGVGDAASNRVRATAGTVVGDSSGRNNIVVDFLDTPSSTSEQTYSFKIMHTTDITVTVYVNRSRSDTDVARSYRTISTLTLSEVAG